MNAGDIVQIRQADTVDHWIYAQVLNPATRLVQVRHPGNVDDSKQKIVAALDIRTKADLQALVVTAQGMAAGRLNNAQISTLAAADAWFAQFLNPDRAHIGQVRDQLHTKIVAHFQNQANALT